MRRLLALVVFVGTVAVALPASAATSTNVVVFAAEGKLYRDLAHPVLLDNTGGDIDDLSASADGSRMVYRLTQSDGQRRTRSIVVRDASGQVVSVVDSAVATSYGDTEDGDVVYGPALSADGNTVLWHHDRQLLSAPVAGGTRHLVVHSNVSLAQPLLAGADVLGFDEDAGALVQVVNGTTRPVIAGDVYGAAISPDGSTVVWRGPKPTPSDDGTESLYVGTLVKQDGLYSVTGKRLLVDASAYGPNPTFSHDGTTVYFSTDDGEIDAVPTAGGNPVDATNTPTRLETTAIGMVLDDGTAPGPVTLTPWLLDSRHVTLAWTLPPDSDLSGVLIQVTHSGYASPAVFVPAPVASRLQTAYGPGTYTFWAVDRSGNISTPVSRDATAEDAFATFPTPAPGPRFTIALPRDGLVSLWYRRYPGGPLVQLLDRVRTSSYVFDKGTLGGSYGFLVQTFDEAGNATALEGAGVAVVPFDQNRAAYTGNAVLESRPDRYQGSAEILRDTTAAARFTAHGSLLALVGERCSSCGVLDVYLDGKLRTTVSTYDATRTVQTTLLRLALNPAHTYTVTLKPHGTPKHPWVVLDGIALRP